MKNIIEASMEQFFNKPFQDIEAKEVEAIDVSEMDDVDVGEEKIDA